MGKKSSSRPFLAHLAGTQETTFFFYLRVPSRIQKYTKRCILHITIFFDTFRELFPPGVLMLNACLTVRAHQANSHQGKGWEKFTDAIIAWFNTNRSGLVFVLWGAYAQKKGAHINKVRPSLSEKLVSCPPGDCQKSQSGGWEF